MFGLKNSYQEEQFDTKKSLDFLIIGAAKSATTTLFELAKNHPEIYMPRDKEVPFFSEEKNYQKGMEWYRDTYFGSASKNSLWGTATPQYMLGEGSLNPEKVAKRIKRELPDIKIIAILREPIARTRSHYQMLAQRGHFTKDFEDATAELLKSKSLGKLRCNNIADTNSFLLGSEYGRILQYYYDRFPAEQILILFTEDLKVNPENTLHTLFEFLGVDSSYKPTTIGQEFRKGGEKPKVKLLTPGVIFKLPLVKKGWDNVPYKFRKKIEYSINLWNIKPEGQSANSASSTDETLKKFYKADVRLLESSTGTKVPWEEWRN